jgi:poly-gamma-glutamate synthesis protein (capsule biosynthesis protein)
MTAGDSVTHESSSLSVAAAAPRPPATEPGQLGQARRSAPLGAIGQADDAASPGSRQVAGRPGGEVTLAFAGDIHFAGRTAKLLADPQTAMGPTSSMLSAADLAMVNLETAITDGGVAEPKQFHFRAPPSAFEALTAAGVDVTTMANNHALDYGQSGLQDTFAAIASTGHPVVGVGRTAAQAYAPWVTTVRGTRIAFLGLSQIRERAAQWTATATHPGIASALDIPTATAAVKAARQQADVVVVYLHWGQEGHSCPTERMKTLATALSAAGADAIVSTHAHLMLGDGYLGRTYVQYGLGNFLWWWDDAFSNDTGVLTLTMRGRQVTKAVLAPARISGTGQPVPATGATAERISADYAKLRACTGLAGAPTPG